MKQLQEPDRAGECRNAGDEEDADAADATPNAPFPFVYGLGGAVGFGATNCFNHLFGGRYVQEGERALRMRRRRSARGGIFRGNARVQWP